MVVTHTAAFQRCSLGASSSGRHTDRPACHSCSLSERWARPGCQVPRPSRLQTIVVGASLTMEPPATTGTPQSQAFHGAANNISVSTLPRAPVDVVKQIHSQQELDNILAEDPHRLVILECKSQACRPCKMFVRKYARLAESYPDCLFLEIIGDESMDTRQMMMGMEVKVTPTFRLYRESSCVNVTTGVNENNLRSAVEKYRDWVPSETFVVEADAVEQ